MEIHKLPLGQGLTWFRQAVNLGARNPRAVFGATLLFIGVLYGTMLLGMLPIFGRLRHGEMGSPLSMLGWLAPLFLIVMFLTPVLLGGLMHVIREAEAGRAVRARDLFIAFHQRKAARLASLGLVQLGFGILGGLLVTALAGQNYWHDYLAAMQAAMSGSVPVMPQPAHPALLVLAQLVFNYFSYTIMLFAIPLMLFSDQSLMQSLSLSVRAAVRNVVPNVLAGVIFVGGMIVAILLVMLLVMFLGLIGRLIHPLIGSALSIVAFMGFGMVVLVVLTGGAYLAWRDTFEGEIPKGSTGTQFEA